MSPRGFAIDNTLLLMLDEERGAFRGGARLAYGLSAALLADLSQLGRVRVSPSAVTATPLGRTGHAVLDDHLAEVRSTGERAPDEWIASWARASLVERVAQRLSLAGTLATRTERSFGMFATQRLHIVPPRLQITIAAHVRGAIVGEAHAVPAEVASVAAILTVLGERRLLRISDGATSARAATLARSDVVAVALERALIRRANTDALNAIAAII